MNNETKLVYKRTLNRVYGLTPAMIEDLGPPDERRRNPRHSGAPDASLYRVDRVEAYVAANKDRIDAARAYRTTQSAAMVASHKQRKSNRAKQLIDWAATVPILVHEPLPVPLFDEVRRKRRFAANNEPIDQQSVHAYVRDEQTNYRQLLQELGCQPGSDEAYKVLKQRVDSAVSAAVHRWQISLTISPPEANMNGDPPTPSATT